MVSAYLELQKNAPQTKAKAPDLTESQANQIKNAAGGEAEYSKIIDWAKNNLPTQQVDAYDQVIDTGNVSAIQIAFNGLRAEYENKMVTRAECYKVNQLIIKEIFTGPKLNL